jgi:hypothetical protein
MKQATVKDEESSEDKESEEGGGDAFTQEMMVEEWENIHHKMLFDAVNETLDSLRPYSLKGPSMPWSRQIVRIGYSLETYPVLISNIN